MRASLFLCLGWMVVPVCGAQTVDLSPLKKWLARQSEVKTVQADFTQTRALRVLKDPLARPGRIAFSAPDSFRWEVGDPARTVVLRKGEVAYLIEPAKKRAQRFAAADLNDPGNLKKLPMVKFPLAKNFEDFNRQFEVRTFTLEGTRCHVELAPRDLQLQQALASLNLDFDTGTGYLLAFEVKTRDGSTMRNDFTNVRFNGKLDARVFDYDFTGYEVVDARN